MMNYVKSELYRVTHGRGVYGFTAVLALLAFLFNALLGLMGIVDGDSFRYDTTSFSYSNLVSTPMLFGVMGGVIVMILYEGNRRNGNLKNTIAFGISRTGVFAGECLVAVLTSIASCVVVLTVYITSAVFFLEQRGPVGLGDLVTAVPAVFLTAVALEISMIVFLEAFDRASTGVLTGFLIWIVAPKVLSLLGLRFEVVRRIAMWMPENFMGPSGMLVNMSECQTAWGTAEGMVKCLLVGLIGVAVFSLAGAIVLRKKEI